MRCWLKAEDSGQELTIAFWGRFPWRGDACVSRYHGPSKRLLERRCGPWAPPPLVLLILLALWLSLVGVGKLGVVLGSCPGILGNQIRVWFCRPSELSPCLLGMSVFSLSSPSPPLGEQELTCFSVGSTLASN